MTVDGTRSTSLTLASDYDIVVDGSLTTSSGALVGLLANNYVRVYHLCSGGDNGTGLLNGPTIDAAILSLTGSFIVDNYNCGANLGNLNVNGAIAQIHRGPVGGSSGYNKSYIYNDVLRTEEPPHFLEPIQASWQAERETECNGSSC